MARWDSDPAFGDLRQLALKLEAAFARANSALLKVSGVTPDEVLETFARVQGKILGFDDHALTRFRGALEEKRVKTLAQGNMFMTCVLSSAVALSEFKRQPRLARATILQRRLDRLRSKSTNPVALGILASASFYALLGKGAWIRWRKGTRGDLQPES